MDGGGGGTFGISVIVLLVLSVEWEVRFGCWLSEVGLRTGLVLGDLEAVDRKGWSGPLLRI